MSHLEATLDKELRHPNEDASVEPTTEAVPKKLGSKAHGKKRTKTGCLTCRKRRIKCGEEKPGCINCVKSKRQCEGYNQRVVFKDPLSLNRPSLVSASNTPHKQALHRHKDPHSTLTPSKKESIALEPTLSSRLQAERFLTSTSASLLLPDLRNNTSTVSHEPSLALSTSEHGVHSNLQKKLPDQPEQFGQIDVDISIKEEYIHTSTPSLETTNFTWKTHTSADQHCQPNTLISQDIFPTTSIDPTPNFNHGVKQSKFSVEASKYMSMGPFESNDTEILDTGIVPSSNNLRNKYQMIWNEDFDDPFDISEDDIEADGNLQYNRGGQVGYIKNDLDAVFALQASQDNQSLTIRSFTSFIDRPNMLAEYIPAPQSTPLQDPMAARIFCHFVNVTGPSMSMFERHPANPSLIFRGAPIPKSQQHIWTYTFPALALHNPALLHAMMALSSLHISKLQNGPLTPSLKHYAIGLRRVAKCVSSDNRRRQPATLAAAMLLAFYECWSADHQKWSNHLLGAKQLVSEIDFAGMTKIIRKQQAQQRQHGPSGFRTNQLEIISNFDKYDTYPSNLDNQIDEDIISILMGKKVLYEQFGHVVNNPSFESDLKEEFTGRDLENYETQRDLFWWYCKQDVYQSILGGGGLFMDFNLWSHCPPRAPLGRLNAIYGSFDHLVLLMGRLAAFAAKDLKRKRLVMKANGGHWQQPDAKENQFTSGQSTRFQPGSQQTSKQTKMPHFTGMVPDIQDPTLPLGFEQTRHSFPITQSKYENVDLDTQTHEAETEWQEIRDAFNVLESRFGPDFQPLGLEFSQPIQTPFGLALQFRTYGIAGIWMNFYMALISCYRSHPAMPPAAMVAAGFSARQTALFANRLGQVAAGISPDCNIATEVNPGIGAALIESATCLFVAGVQYQDAAQRFWTVERLRNIARLTGWQTALAIATGCETCWVKAGELGRGPPYTRTTEEQKLPDIGTGSRRIDRAFSGKSSEERRRVIEKPDRVHYALGILGLEGDFENIDLDGSRQGSVV